MALNFHVGALGAHPVGQLSALFLDHGHVLQISFSREKGVACVQLEEGAGQAPNVGALRPPTAI